MARSSINESNRVACLTDDDKRWLLATARKHLTDHLSNVNVHNPAMPDTYHSDIPNCFQEIGASFVTLLKHGELRGCIGHLNANQSIYQDVLANVIAAATQDYRFPSISLKEMNDLTIAISLLTEPTAMSPKSKEALVDCLRIHEDGVIVQYHNKQATFLPSVWESLSDKSSFVSELLRKANIPNDVPIHEMTWKKYQVIYFKEEVLCSSLESVYDKKSKRNFFGEK